LSQKRQFFAEIFGENILKSKTSVPGTEIRNIFAEKFGEEIGIFPDTTACFAKKLSITLVFVINANTYFAENWQKSQKLVIISHSIDPR
jgi:hypothetical protein